MFGGVFRRAGARSNEVAEASRRVRESVLELLGAEVSVTVSEILCPDPACPDLETVILLGRPGRPTAAVKIRKPLTEVRNQDVAAALAGMTGEGSS